MTRPVSDPTTIVPRLAPEVETIRTGDGALRLRGPLLRRPLLLRGLAWMFARPKRIDVELDDIGTWVVERCDGRTLESLAIELAAHLRLSRREAETALADFMKMLLMRRLVRLDCISQPDETVSAVKGRRGEAPEAKAKPGFLHRAMATSWWPGGKSRLEQHG